MRNNIYRKNNNQTEAALEHILINFYKNEMISFMDAHPDLKEEYEVILFDICMNIWEQINKNPLVRHTAIKFIIKIAKKHSDLSREITFLTQDHYLESLSPGVKKSISKMMDEPTM